MPLLSNQLCSYDTIVMSFSKSLLAANDTTAINMPKRANANLLVAISLKFIVFTYNDAYWEYIFDRYLADLWSILECLIVCMSAVLSHTFNVLGCHIFCNKSAGRCEVSETSFKEVTSSLIVIA